MSFRQDKLILLLDTGSSPQVRQTAAKQLSDLVNKTFHVPPRLEPEVKVEDDQGQDQDQGPVTIKGEVNVDDAWAEVLDTIGKVLPLLKSKSSETRHAAAQTLGLLAASLPAWTGSTSSRTSDDSLSPLDLPQLIRTQPQLLASAGREYASKPSAGDRAKRKKAMMGSLGLGDGVVGWGEDVDKVIGEEDDEDVNGVASGKDAVPTPPAAATPKNIFEGLSARQVAMLKRKKGNIAEEANKLRKLNEKSAGPTPDSGPSSASATPRTSPSKPPTPLPGTESVTIDPGAKARAAAAAAAASSGGAVEPPMDADGNPIVPTSTKTTLTLKEGQNPWEIVLLELVPGLSNAVWQTRHGSALGMMEILRSSIIDIQELLLYFARHLLTLLVLDRFGDFLGDTVVAPVRETAAQTLGVLLRSLDPSGLREVHDTLMGMVLQPWARRGKDAEGREKWEKFAWELRHAGLLGLKYEVAVMGDKLAVKEVKMEVDEEVVPGSNGAGKSYVQDVVRAVILALQDSDDDVRTVAASALIPITDILTRYLSTGELAEVVDTLWDCLGEGGDELGSSTGAVMDLLGALIAHEEVIAIMSSEERASGPRSRHQLISRIYGFMRHPITSVRLAVSKALHTFATVPNLPRKDWMFSDFASLSFQNLLLEERVDIRQLSFSALSAALQECGSANGLVDSLVASLEGWYSLVMTPVGAPLDPALFVYPKTKATASHNVDKPMMDGDMGLVSMDTALQTRISAANALALLRQYRLEKSSDLDLLHQYLNSGSAHQIFITSTILQEWAISIGTTSSPLAEIHPAVPPLSTKLISIIESPPLATYHEMSLILSRVRTECQALLTAFHVEAKVSKSKIPDLPSKVDPLSHSKDLFSLSTAQQVVGPQFDALAGHIPKSSVKVALPALKDRQRKVMSSIGYFSIMKERYDVQVSAAVAGALIAMKTMPGKFGPVIKAVMDAVKKEENVILQTRAAQSVAAFIEYCSSPLFTGKVNPSDKVVKNLFTFLCQDVSVVPVFSSTLTEGITSLKEDKQPTKTKTGMKDVPEETEEQIAARVTRRGALEAFKALAVRFGDKLLVNVEKFWEGISAGIITGFPQDLSPEQADERLKDGSLGQDVLDCLSSLRLVAPELNPSLHPKLVTLLPYVISSLQSSYSVVRNTAAKCLAALCDVIPQEGMKYVVDHVVPLVGDAKRISARQGAVEAIHHIIRVLEIKALPYVLFLIVPVLGRMSDPNESVRLLSTSTFASLVKMVPLEAGIPDPPGFSPELLAKRDEERKFLLQLLDGSKAEQYKIPIEIKADLRQYQKDGVSWLAFLAKYQLHGILCDDMGLGKSLQSICIIGSKMFERAEKFKTTRSVDSAHLPSLIVCPPTLTGHWYYEILKFTDDLKPLQYVGNAAQRASLRSRFGQFDVVITSYESVRADVSELSQMEWLYCVLDEGHIIKNAKTKLSSAVKQLRAQHRLLLSGTPIQNNVLELWSLFDFLMPGFLGNERVFNDRFSKPILADRDGKATAKERDLAAAALEALHKQVLPFVLRRLKEDVLSDLPPKIIQDYQCELSEVQKLLYDEFAKSRAAEEAGEEIGDEGHGQQHVFQSLQYLRKLCNHPALVLDSEPERFKALQRKMGGEVPSLHDIVHAPKLLALKQLLIDCDIGVPLSEKLGAEADSQHRVLIFCQLRPMLDIIERDLFKSHLPSLTYMRMDGSTDPRKRQSIVQTFNSDPRIDVLLLTTSVGGLGLNLTGADTVIFVDHDWNPMKDLQAMDRAHRLGQRKVVNVYRLITRGTLEEKIMGLQRFKLNIASSVVTQQNAALGSMNTGEVLDLFKVSAEGEPQKEAKVSSGPVSASKVLEGLEDLPPEDEYAELSLSNFMSKI